MRLENSLIVKAPVGWGYDFEVSSLISDVIKEKKINTISIATKDHDWKYLGNDAQNYYMLQMSDLFFEDRQGKGTYLYAYQGGCYSDDFWGVKEGYVVIGGAWKKAVSFLKDRYKKVKELEKIRNNISKNEEKMKELRKKGIPLKELNSLRKKFESDEEELTPEEEVIFSENIRIRADIEKLQEKNKKKAKERDALKKDSDLFLFQPYIEFNFMKAMKNLDPLYISDELAVFEIDKSKSIFGYEKLDKLSKLSTEKSDDKAALEKYLVGYDYIDFKFKEKPSPSLLSALHKEKVSFFDEELMNSVEVKPAAPVKPSIAASMVAAGGSSTLSQSMVMDGDEVIWKDTMVQVVKTEQISENGSTKRVSSKAFEARMGVFNKTRREFSVLS